MNKIKYGLLHKKTKKVLSYYTSSNDGGDFCVDTQYILSLDGEKMWLVDDKYQAEYVRNFSTEWYGAGYDTPTHEFDPDELTVVSVEVIIHTEEVKVRIPTMEEYLKINYKERDLAHYNYCMKELKARRLANYSLFDLHEMMRKDRWPTKGG